MAAISVPVVYDAAALAAEIEPHLSIPGGGGSGLVGVTRPEDHASFQEALTAFLAKGGVFWLEPGKVYPVEPGLSLWRTDMATQPGNWVIAGNGATLDMSATTVTAGAGLTVGADMAAIHEKGSIVIRDLTILGPEPVNPYSASSAATGLTGLKLDQAINVTLDNVRISRFYRGLETKFCFPLTTLSLNLRENFIGAWLDNDTTLGAWTMAQFVECWWGVMMRPGTDGHVYGQSFYTSRFEGCRVGMALDPRGASGGVGVFGIAVHDPYVEGIAHDAFRFALQQDLANPAPRGSDSPRPVSHFRIFDGLWSLGTASSLVGASVSSKNTLFRGDIPVSAGTAVNVPSAWRVTFG